jgi:hypothetical protein
MAVPSAVCSRLVSRSEADLKKTQDLLFAVSKWGESLFDLHQLASARISYENQMIRRRTSREARSTKSSSAHVLERTGLALTGASCALFVAAHVGRSEV